MPKRNQAAVIEARRNNGGTRYGRKIPYKYTGVIPEATAPEVCSSVSKIEPTKPNPRKRCRSVPKARWKRSATPASLSLPIQGTITGREKTFYVVSLVGTTEEALLGFAQCPNIGSTMKNGSRVSCAEAWIGKDEQLRLYDPTFL